MKKIRWGIVGPGEIANKFAKAIKNVECAELVAVASRTEEKGRAFAQKYNIKNVFCGYEKMARSDIVDAVYISTPHPFHSSCAQLFINAKKHVLCEKPVCINASQAQKLKELAEENNVFLMEAMWTRFLPAVKEIDKLIKSGEIGEVLEVSADFCYRSSPEIEEKLFKNDMAGGSLLDVGVYGLHFADMFLEGEPQEICAMSHIRDGVDVRTNILVKYERGTASISSAIDLQKPEAAYVYGTKGYIYIPAFYGATEFTLNIGDEQRLVNVPCIGDGFEEEIIEACECIEQGKTESGILPVSVSVKMLKLMDEARAQTSVKYPFDGEKLNG